VSCNVSFRYNLSPVVKI